MAKIVIYSTRVCPYCVAAKNLFDRLGAAYEDINLDGKNDLRAKLSDENNGWRTVPMIFIDDKFIGGYDDLNALNSRGDLMPLLNK